MLADGDLWAITNVLHLVMHAMDNGDGEVFADQFTEVHYACVATFLSLSPRLVFSSLCPLSCLSVLYTSVDMNRELSM